jgi:hypothetical protein
MDGMIARLNIEHLKRKLAEEKDDAQRQILQRLLEEEESKLKAAGASPAGRKRTRAP